ncbi:MAG TPA: hypothetical protein ENK91_08720, partial [Bacteroidetes bacterium]|nr:hypothetical protein [Bacteroidota bacterium]
MKKKNNILTLILILAIIFIVNVIAQYYFKTFDFTDDKRYTLSKSTVNLLKNQKDVIYVKVLLEGDFPAGFVRLKRNVRNILNEFNSINPKIDFEFQNPLEGSVKEINQAKEALRKQGILPVTLFIGEGNSKTEKNIYPYAIFNYGKRVYVVNLLESQVPGVPQ